MIERSTSQGRISFLDAFRGLAAFSVFVFHTISVTLESFATFSRQSFDLGYCGVVIFFFCSGFIIPLTIERQRTYLHAAIVGTLVFGLGYTLRDRPSPRILLDIGQVSYSLYLLHVLVIAMVPRLASVPLALLVWLIVALPVSILTERWVERPGIALGRRLTRSPS